MNNDEYNPLSSPNLHWRMLFYHQKTGLPKKCSIFHSQASRSWTVNKGLVGGSSRDMISIYMILRSIYEYMYIFIIYTHIYIVYTRVECNAI